MIKVSIIVPIYNVEKYLKRCLDSLVNQTLNDIEIICINDGSTDGSLEILEEYRRRDDRIVIINQENSGQSVARNRGIDVAKGEYIGFVDSDDWVSEDYFEKLYAEILSKPEIVIFGAMTFYENVGKTKAGQYSSKNFPSKFNINKLFQYHTICMNKIYRKDFLVANGIKFAENQKYGEEQLLFVKSLILAKNVSVIKKDMYNYRKNRKESLTGQKYKKDFSPILTCYSIINFLSNIDDNNLKYKIYSKYLQKTLSWRSKLLPELREEYFVKLKELFAYIHKNIIKGWWDYYNLPVVNSYIVQKLEYAKAQIFYNLIEYAVYTLALISFGCINAIGGKWHE